MKRKLIFVISWDGHFVSLIQKSILPFASNLHKICAEKNLLHLLCMQENITSASLGRLKPNRHRGGAESAPSLVLFRPPRSFQDILQTLDVMHLHYGRETDCAVLVRQIIRKINNVITTSDSWNTNCLDFSVFMDEVPVEAVFITLSTPLTTREIENLSINVSDLSHFWI